MSRSLKVLAAGLSLDELRHLLSVKEKLSTLEKRKSQLEKELAKIEIQIAKLVKGDKKALRGAKAVKRTKATRKKATRAKPAAAKKTVRKAATRKKAPVRRKAAGRQTVETVVADLIRKRGEPMKFQDILTTINRKKLVKTKSKNFANVLRRTLSTSKLLKRKGRGIYGVS
ncbi:hypothetical protein KKG45_00425 [bacterium]|nr:hypothetical protein [bacterium]MBU1071689.1 hypothetical protein [bacterium]MBU1675369.1 hypothetical protein [bacterium]